MEKLKQFLSSLKEEERKKYYYLLDYAFHYPDGYRENHRIDFLDLTQEFEELSGLNIIEITQLHW